MLRRRPLSAASAVGVVLVLLIIAVLARRVLPGPASSSPTQTAQSSASASRTATETASQTSATSTASTAPVGPTHIWLIVFENRSYGEVIGSRSAPYFNELAARFALATNYHAVARPSQPNYLALISGSTQGVTDNEAHTLTAPTLLDQLDVAQRSWRVFAENVPSGCFTGASASGGPDGAGTYARKHEPAISFRSVSSDPARCMRITNLSAFDPGAADFNLVIPNLCHSMHDCSTAEGDHWLASFAPRIVDSAAWRSGGVLLITFDEADGRDASQHVPLIIASPRAAPGTRITQAATHYGLLRTIENAWGLPCLAQSCASNPIPLPGR
jgi:phosphatidylinositol-3-phosphatase